MVPLATGGKGQAVSEEEILEERRRLATLALELTKKRGKEITLSILATESETPRIRLEQFFEDDSDLFESVAELWMEKHISIMEEVVASDLPPNRKMYEF
ncbi:MAG TPA: hypothetical protein DCS24_04525, partial [Erythrobacter sp.]|nr:hypothetical protein [Erythrobacter sp.]